MNDYLKVGDWVQIEINDPWTKIIEPETWCRNAVGSNHVKVGVSSKPYKILRKGSVYVQKNGLANYVLLFEKMEGDHAYGPMILPIVSDVRDNVKFDKEKVTAPRMELAEDQEYWLSCFAAKEILKTDKYNMACEMLNIERKDMTAKDSVEDSIKEQLAKVQIDFSMIEGGDREKASKEVQEFLFENGFKWKSNDVVAVHVNSEFLHTSYWGDNTITCSSDCVNKWSGKNYENKYTYLEFKDKFMSNDSLKVGDYFEFSGTESQNIIDYFGAKYDKAYEITEVDGSRYRFVNDSGAEIWCFKERVKKVAKTKTDFKVGDWFKLTANATKYRLSGGDIFQIKEIDEEGDIWCDRSDGTEACILQKDIKKAAKPETDSKETIFKVGDYFEVVDDTSRNVCDFGVRVGDIYQIEDIHQTLVRFAIAPEDLLFINISSIKKVPKPTEDSKLSEELASLKAKYEKQAEMLSLAWLGLEEYDNAFSFRSQLVEFLRERVDSTHDVYSQRLMESQNKHANLLCDMSKFLLENFSNREGVVKIGHDTFKCKKKMRLF